MAVADGQDRTRSSIELRRANHANRFADAIARLGSFLPLSRASFERRLAAALAGAGADLTGFHLGGYAARRALGRSLEVTVSPASIERKLDHRVRIGARIVSVRDRFLGTGDWSSVVEPVRKSATFREVTEIVAADLDYRRTRAYRVALKRHAGPHPVHRNFVYLTTPELVEAYFQQTADLCRSIQTNGVQRRDQFRATRDRNQPNRLVRLPWVETFEGEIGVAIGPDGELFSFSSGKHRTAAAKALGIAAIPVEVRLVHAQWLRRHHAANPSGSLVEALLRGIRELDVSAPEFRPAS